MAERRSRESKTHFSVPREPWAKELAQVPRRKFELVPLVAVAGWRRGYSEGLALEPVWGP